jgi:DNA-binding NarL/FixJ family response regulator
MEAQAIRILLVDDDPSFLHSLEALLEGEPGLEIVGKAASGKEALAAAARAEPDVAVVDVLMPAMGGIECAHLLQQRYPNTRVILISGSIFEDKRPHPDERGTDAYLEKSEVPARLHAMILALGADTIAAPPNRKADTHEAPM